MRPSPPPAQGRLVELDALRGLAATVVVLHHALRMAGLVTGRFHDVLLMTPLRIIDAGRPAVIFFFVLSGYVLTLALRRVDALRPRQYAAWVAQRTIRLCLPAALSLVLSALLYAWTYDPAWRDAPYFLGHDIWTAPPSLGNLLRSSALLGTADDYKLNIVLWSLVHEWRFSLLLPFIGLAVFRGRGGAALLVLAGLALHGVMGGSGDGLLMLGPTLLSTVRATLYLALPFAAGTAMALGGFGSLPGGRWHVPAAIIAAVALTMRVNDACTTVGSVLLIWAALQPGPFQRMLRHPILAWSGRVSFSLYLVHLPILAACLYGLHGTMPLAAAAALGTALSYLGAEVFHRLAEQPAHRLAKRFHLRRTVPPVGPAGASAGHAL